MKRLDKGILMIILVMLATLIIVPIKSIHAAEYLIEYTDKGLVTIKHPSIPLKMEKIMVEKSDKKVTFGFNEKTELVPLQYGEGKYTIKILQHVTGTRYKVITKKIIYFDGKLTEKELYTQSMNKVKWKGIKELENTNKALFKEGMTEYQKVEKTYDYIVRNIKYDTEKIKGLDNNYTPKIGQILTDKKGICYDYVVVFGGILRSQGIPTKLVMGYKNDMKEYHAWNEVMLGGEWKLIDTTYDAALRGSKKITMYKAPADYTKDREY